MKFFCALWIALVLAGCSTHQDLKAPYDASPLVPVLNQWDNEDSENE